ncbi:MAG TPA: hypothetical protein VN030_06415 [Cellvibrio sp.]|nr:hypothetical protein [Cellvibrio sp.]
MNLPTDEDTNIFFNTVLSLLQKECNYSYEESCSLIQEYYINFTNSEYCQKLGIPVQDDDFFFHEGAGGMALRIHYYLGLKANPEPEQFIEWRSNTHG